MSAIDDYKLADEIHKALTALPEGTQLVAHVALTMATHSVMVQLPNVTNKSLPYVAEAIKANSARILADATAAVRKSRKLALQKAKAEVEAILAEQE